MEEIVGRWWHNTVMRLAQNNHANAVVHLSEVQKSMGMFFRAAGGAATIRLAPASERIIGGPRGWMQRLAGTGERAATTYLEPEVLSLPASISLFAQPQLNRDLYLWLAIQSASFEHTGNWVQDNWRASHEGLQRFPGFEPRYHRLRAAHLRQRVDPGRLRGQSALNESIVQQALRGEIHTTQRVAPNQVAPVWLWVDAGEGAPPPHSANGEPKPTKERAPNQDTVQDHQRRRAQRTHEAPTRHAMVLPFRAEALMSWSEMVNVNRSTDDEDDGNAVAAANDMEKLSVAPDGQTLASRVKFDLDLPSSSADDLPLGPGILLPEWDYRRSILQPNHCVIQPMELRPGAVFLPSQGLRRTANRVSRRLEMLRSEHRPQHGQDSGEDIDLDAWVRYRTEQTNDRALRTDTPAVYTRAARSERSLSTLLLADLSLSTDAHATSDAKVIEVIRDALFVFGTALHTVGDPFSILGFSSVRRQHVRVQHLKGFDETWNETTRSRVGAIRPGYYTRMGAAIRYAIGQLSERPERRRLLMLLTDGKPNDLDIYEGRYGLEDTRHAIQEAHRAGLSPFCVTIDETGHDYLPILFGQRGYALVRQPQDLVNRLTQAWVNLARG